MKIRHLPTSPKAGLVEHIENTVGRTLIALGHAEEIKMPPYGAKGWLEARLEQSAHAGPPDAYDVDPSAMQRKVDDKFQTEPPKFPFSKK